MSDIAIEFKDVTKKYKLFKNDKQRFLSIFSKGIKYKEKVANDSLNFRIEKGESVAIIGKNGAGKSTILKMVTGTAFPTSGKITVNGRVSALLELTAGFDPELTGRENIYFKGQIMGFTKKEMNEVIDEIIGFSEIGEYVNQPVRTYSSGMKARLGFAVSANVEPEIFVIDEALSVGDAQFSKKCKIKIDEIKKKKNVTFLFVTHATRTAKDFCDRGIVLQSGKITCDSNIDNAIKKYEEAIK